MKVYLILGKLNQKKVAVHSKKIHRVFGAE